MRAFATAIPIALTIDMGPNANGKRSRLKSAIDVNAVDASSGSPIAYAYTTKTMTGCRIGAPSIVIEKPYAMMYASRRSTATSSARTACTILANGPSHA